LEKDLEHRDYSTFYPKTSELSKELKKEVDSIFHNASNYEEFKNKIEIINSKLSQESVAIKKLKSHNITTFCGEGLEIPRSIRNLLLEISKIKVHSLTELRDPIGEKEAARLPELKVSGMNRYSFVIYGE
jgi:hypothetical protein